MVKYCGLILILLGTIGFSFGDYLNPCENNVVSVFDFPNSNNMWNGIVHLGPQQKSRVVRVDLKLAARAIVSLIDNDGHITVAGNTFHIIFKSLRARDQVRFNVRGTGKNFPYIVKLNVNGVNSCKNPQRWKYRNAGFTGLRTTRRPGPRRTTVNPDPSSEYDYSDTINYEPRMDRDPNECGKRKVLHQGLITNGYPSKEGDWPWHVAIYHFDTKSSSSYKCGGTLISHDTVLTAAHCVSDGVGFLVPTRILVKVGLHNRLVAGRNTQEVPVFSIVPHDAFQVSDLRNDIAILKLANAVSFNDYVLPVCLWPKQQLGLEHVVNRNGMVVGWGLNEADSLQDILTQGEMPVVNFTECLQSNRDFFGMFLTENNYCAGFRNGTSVCNGDSGGGMFFNENGAWHIRGVVSLSVSREDKDVCNPQQYVLFTDTAKYANWIEKVAE